MFRQLVNELTLLLTYEATKGLADEEVEIETPLERTTARRISGKKVAICPILRAGMGMLDGVLSLVPGARVGFIGLYRDEETLQPVEYYASSPGDIADRDVILLDPMLATGNSTAAAVETVKGAGDLRSADRADRGARRPSSGSTETIPTSRSWSRPSTARSTRRASSSRGWATQAIACTARSRPTDARRPRSNPEVLWGALIAFAVVVLLTPPSAGWRDCSASSTSPTSGGSTSGRSRASAGSRSSSGSWCPSLAFLYLSR